MLPIRPAPEVVITTRPSTDSPALEHSLQWAMAWRAGAKWPFRWTRVTESHSSSLMLASIRSRRKPALHTRASKRPNDVMA